jgi:CDP-glucose 4,6-dehydratase
MSGFWSGRRVLVTGHTGFKGSWLSLWLRTMGAHVEGLALAPPTHPSLHVELGAGRADDQSVDIRDMLAVQNRVLKADPEIVFHLAAQPLVRAGYRDPAATFAINAQGTANILEALRLAPGLSTIVVVTTDKVYENDETGHAFCEDDPLGGHDPYSASKAAAEIIAASYRKSFYAGRAIGLATARAGNVIGGGDWAEDRLIPDAVRAFSRGQAVQLRRPSAVRPWQHVLESLSGYLLLAERLHDRPALAGAYNFGPDHHAARSVGDVLAMSVQALGFGEIDQALESEGPHEAGYLMLDSTKARRQLGFAPRFTLEETIRRTWEWYGGFLSGRRAIDLCMADLDAFSARGQEPRSALA